MNLEQLPQVVDLDRQLKHNANARGEMRTRDILLRFGALGSGSSQPMSDRINALAVAGVIKALDEDDRRIKETLARMGVTAK